MLITREIRLLLLLSQLTSDKQGRYQLYATRSHSGGDGQGARNAAPSRRLRPHVSRPMRALQFVEPQPIRRESARCIWHVLELETKLKRQLHCMQRAHGWLFVCSVLPIERFDFTLKPIQRICVCPVTTLIWQFQSTKKVHNEQGNLFLFVGKF